MKKILLCVTTLLLCSVVIAQKNYNIKFNKQDFTFKKTEKGYKIKSKEGKFYFKSDTTSPALPYVSINILIPENSSIQNIKYDINKSLLFEDIDIVNNTKVHKTSERYIETYRSSDFSGKKYPKENLKFVSINKIQNFSMASFTICPFIYDNKELSLINSIDFSFDVITNKNRKDDIKRYDAINLVGDLVLNPDELITLYPNFPAKPLPEDVEYLIITSKDLMDDFKLLKSWKIKKGIRTKIISTEDIYSKYPGSTNQLKIKNCLYYYYKNRGLKWVLLGGDSNIIPVQYCHFQHQENDKHSLPTDLFYACYDKCFDWNADGDELIAEPEEDNVDLSPEVFISRAPVRTSKHVQTFSDKTINYEKYNVPYDYVNTMLLAGKVVSHFISEKNNISDSHDRSEEMYNTCIKPYWKGRKTKFYDTGTDFIQVADYDFTKNNLQDQLNRCYHFVHIYTHGFIQSYQMEFKGPSYDQIDAEKLNNEAKSIVVTASCLTNAFDIAEPSLSEAMFRNPKGGCVLYWGSSRSGWSFLSMDFSDEFFYNVFRKHITNDEHKFANITTKSKLRFIGSSNRYDLTRWLQFTQNAIGDPELSIFTDTPKEFSNATVKRIGEKVIVNTGVSGCDIALTSMNDGETYFKVYKNVSTATFTNSIFNDPKFNFYVTITKHNYKPFEYPKDIYIQNCTFNKDQCFIAPNIYVGRNVTSTKPIGDVIIKDNVKVIFAPSKNVFIKEGFKIEKNGSFTIKR
ncbi:C25 family cysteine peptidase [Vallitalea sp.]|jgi:hypothetical protein|uniref:C25 family cysteine peptidase n=1 Tax=Vallitalea sp. TaxID=1882829 RepID=UPI0025DA8E61|nr:C25 family cysteine peptidase [Vallitalea sp.]MCT4688509.1 C25 family cysteine peptidase [Vallitalea sp.]